MEKVVDGPKLRLLHCKVCGTVEELAWYEGPVERDAVLEAVVGKHSTNGMLHQGFKLYDVAEKVWVLEPYRKSIIDQIKGGSPGLKAFDQNYYAVHDTLKEDALACFSLHMRPKEDCYDWRSDRKLLVPDTKAERKEIGLSMEGAPKRWLCDFCPVRSHYERKSREGR